MTLSQILNQVQLGDCLDNLGKLPNETFDLIYLDPPFFTQKKHSLVSKDRKTTFEFSDTWTSLDAYLSFMRERLEQLKRVLKTSGSIFLHCDTSASHHLRILMDEVFGTTNFRSEIIWTYRRWTNSARSLIPSHQVIFFYSKSESYKFNTVFGSYSESTNVDQILQLRQRDADSKTKYLTDGEGNVIFGKNKDGVPLGDTWEIPYLNPKAKERVSYPTQKPLLLIERILEIASDEGDFVLDPFCGSGTTLVAAKLLNRNYFGIDRNPAAIELTNSRLSNPVRTKSELMEKGRDAYRGADEEALTHLAGLDYVEVHRNKGIDAFLRTESEAGMIPARIQRKSESLIESANYLVKASKSKGVKQAVLIRTKLDETLPIDNEIPDWIIVVDAVSIQIKQLLQLPLRS